MQAPSNRATSFFRQLLPTVEHFLASLENIMSGFVEAFAAIFDHVPDLLACPAAAPSGKKPRRAGADSNTCCEQQRLLNEMIVHFTSYRLR
jgi:hypothetical protein